MHKPADIQTLYIDFDSFFASVEQQLVPAFRGRPMGVLPLDSPNSGCIAVSREAKALGIKRGARLRDAQEICPNFVVAIARHDEYVAMHTRIYAVINACVPIHKTWSVDEVECRLKANERREWRALAETIRAQLARHIGPYVTPSIGFGANQVLAKIAAEMDKPNGLVCLHPSDMPAAIFGLKLSDIPGVGRRMEERLNDAGIKTVRALMGLSGKQMRALWRSVEGERMWAGLHGYSTQTQETTRGMFGHGRILAPEWRNKAGVRNCARLLLVKAVRRLRRENYAAKNLMLSVGFQGKERRKQVRSVPLPAFDDHTFLAHLEVMLARLWRTAPQASPFKVSVCVFSITPIGARMEDLLETTAERAARLRWESLSLLSDNLNQHYTSTVLSVGTYIEPPGGYTGGKIAFGRIPEKADFV